MGLDNQPVTNGTVHLLPEVPPQVTNDPPTCSFPLGT